MTSVLGSVVGFASWSYIPDLTTKILLRIFRRWLPKPANPMEYRIAFSLVVLSYMIYNFVDALVTTPPNYYDMLNVPPEVDVSGLKTAFRSFARRNHPDRVGPQGTLLFMTVREGYEALRDPRKRWAYDRFGPEVLTCYDCVTAKEYLYHGMLMSLGFHIVSGLALLFFSAIGKGNGVAFWRYLMFFALSAAELSLVFTPAPSSRSYYVYGRNIITFLLPSRLAFQNVKLLHQVFLFLSIGLSRITPVLFPHSVEPKLTTAAASVAVMNLSTQLKLLEREIHTVLKTDMFSIRPPTDGSSSSLGRNVFGSTPDEDTFALLTREMENMMIEGRLGTEGGVLAAKRTEAIERGRNQGILPSRRRTSSNGNRNGIAATRQAAAPLSTHQTKIISVGDLPYHGLPSPSSTAGGYSRLNTMWLPQRPPAVSASSRSIAAGTRIRARSKSY